MTRRLRAGWVAAALLAVAFTLAACGGGDETTGSETGAGGEGGGSETISFLQPVPGGESMFYYPYIVGEELGFFEEEGIEVEFLSANSTIPMPAYVANGDVDIAAAGADQTLISASQGGEFVVAYEEFTLAADTISVRDDSEIQTAADLEGRTVGLEGQEDRVVLETALEIEGVDPAAVKTIVVGTGGPSIAVAIESGKIDAYASGISETAVTEGLSDVAFREIIPEELAHRPPSNFVVSPQTFENRKDALVGFMRAWAKATEAAFLNREVVEEMGLERIPEQFESKEIADTILDFAIAGRETDGEPFGSIHPEEWETTQDQLLAAGEQKGTVDLESLLDDSLVAEANEFEPAEVEAAIETWEEQHAKP